MAIPGFPVEALTKADVLLIHNKLVEDFALSSDPIWPPGVKSDALLESAIGRQYTGLGDRLKYPSIHENAATLLYGICCDHPFHNGNKRTALVSMLAHLDRNYTTLFDVTEREIFNMIISVADHTVGLRVDPRSKRPRPIRRNPDEEVAAIAEWIYRHLGRVERGERQVTYRELRRILGRFGYSLHNPKKNSVDVVKKEVRNKGLLRKEQVVELKRIGNIPFPGDTQFVRIGLLKHVRRMCNLTEAAGVDSQAFYDAESIVDAFINKYRTMLRRLGRR